jgi:pimeloyl-ACP methyl ester carboxylesterase
VRYPRYTGPLRFLLLSYVAGATGTGLELRRALRSLLGVNSYRHPGTVLTDHHLGVPLDHGNPGGEQIEIFAREIVAAGQADRAGGLPWLVFLQGGPGIAAQRPVGRDGWLDRALDEYRVLLLDQRGTGRSAKITARSLAGVGSPRAQAEYLANFRADSIVLDCELLRRALCGDRPWTVLGQSFGGFCAVTYLSFAPQGVAEALITGGLPALDAHDDDIYRLTYPIVAARNAAHYERYPADVAMAREVAGQLASGNVRLPDGSRLTVERFQAIGGMLGQSGGSHQLHYLLEDPFDGDGGLSDAFLADVWARVSFATAPLYAVLHEACCAQGAPTRWSAQRIRAEFGQFDAAAAIDGDAPLSFTGEMIYPWMLDLDPALVPLREAAHLLAEREGWPPLYDPATLAANAVPAAAAVYYNDMYVPAPLSLATAARIRGLRTWVTSEWEHDGLRVSGGAVLSRLIAMNRGEALPSGPAGNRR